jgi:hypothetical protein
MKDQYFGDRHDFYLYDLLLPKDPRP